MQVIECWELFQWDGGEGRTNQSIGFLSNKKDAEFWNNANMGSHISHRTLIIADSYQELFQMEIEKKKTNALAKLTPEERKLLGL